MIATGLAAADRPIVIAHRGASGYLPEHTLAAVALAYAMGADYIEQDVVLSKDGVPVVLHDIHLDTVTNVATKFAGRSRPDGRFYAVDFTLPELQSLRVNERIDPKSGQRVFANRFPLNRSRFHIATLEEQIQLIQGLNQTTGRNIGIYPEIKNPAWHRQHELDISQIVLGVLKQYGYESSADACFLQCFDQDELKRIRLELGVQLRLVQLLSDKPHRLRTESGLREIASYAHGIGPALTHILDIDDNRSRGQSLTAIAHQCGLRVHPYTVRSDLLPRGLTNMRELLTRLVQIEKVDGMFTDFPDQCAAYLDATQSR